MLILGLFSFLKFEFYNKDNNLTRTKMDAKEIETLKNLLKKHQEQCFQKSNCDICHVKIDIGDFDTYQCDICGSIYDDQGFYNTRARCYCEEQEISLCRNCPINSTYGIRFIKIEDPEDMDAYMFAAACCPTTKGIK